MLGTEITAKRTIMVVDDQRPVRQLISRMLSHSGFNTIEAGNGPEALALVDRAPESIDLAIIDVLMPRMSGLDVAAELGRQHPDLKILYMSANSHNIANDCIRHRAPELLLLKPFTESILVDRVDGLLGSRLAHQSVSSIVEPD